MADIYRRADKIKNDQLLYQTLSKILRDRRLTSDQINELVHAPGDNDHSMIKLVLEQEPVFIRKYFLLEHFNKSDSFLSIAVCHPYLNSVELLLRSGADANQNVRLGPSGDKIFQRIIHSLCFTTNERLLRLLIDHAGADFQAQSFTGRQTALHIVVKSRNLQLTEMLLKEGVVDINLADDKGMTPMLLAVTTNKADQLLPLLVKHGADVNVKNLKGENALHCLALYSDPVECCARPADVVRILIEKGVSLGDRDNECLFQPIHMAAWIGNNELVKLYLDYGAEVNARAGDDGVFPLYLAVDLTPNLAVLDTLLERGANIDLKTTKGRTALHNICECIAQFHRRESTIRLLLSAGADMLVEDVYGNTPLALTDRECIVNPGTWLMLKALALKKACQSSIVLKDELLIQGYPKVLDYYRNCHAHISRMKFTLLIGNCTFFDIITKSRDRIAAFMRNPNFKENFKLYDLNGFSMYATDIQEAFERAQRQCHFMLEQEEELNEAVNFILPDTVVRRIVRYLWLLSKNA